MLLLTNLTFSDCHRICKLDFDTRMVLIIIHTTLNKITILNDCINDNEDDDDDDSLVVWCSSSCLGHSTILGRIQCLGAHSPPANRDCDEEEKYMRVLALCPFFGMSEKIAFILSIILPCIVEIEKAQDDTEM